MNIEPVTITDAKASPKPGPGAIDLAMIMAEIEDLSDDETTRIAADVCEAGEVGLATAERLEPWLEQLDQLVGFWPKWARSLGIYARAAMYAFLVAERPTAPTQMISEATQLRKKLLGVAETLVIFGKADTGRVEAIRSGVVGHMKLANDLVELNGYYRELWPKLESQPFVTVAMIERAGTLGFELHERLGGVGDGPFPGSPELDAKQIRNRAWTLFVRAYGECRRAMLYLAPDQLDEIAPSLFQKGPRREAEDEPASTEPEAGASSGE